MQGLYEKGAPDEVEAFMYQLVDLTGDGLIQRFFHPFLRLILRQIVHLMQSWSCNNDFTEKHMCVEIAYRLTWGSVCSLYSSKISIECFALVCRAEVEGVILSILQTVLGSKDAMPDASLPEGSLQAFHQSASFTDEVEGEDAPSMSLEDFRKWCASVPSIKKFLLTLFKGPVPGILSTSLPFSFAFGFFFPHPH